MTNAPCFTLSGSPLLSCGLLSLLFLAACVPSANNGAGVLMASNTTVASPAVMSYSRSSQDQAIVEAPIAPSPPPLMPLPDPKRLQGLDPAVTMGLLGEPIWRRLDGPAQVYSFVSKACRANIYFMRADDTAPFLLNHAEFQPLAPDNALTDTSCLASFFQADGIPSMLLKETEAKEPVPQQP